MPDIRASKNALRSLSLELTFRCRIVPQSREMEPREASGMLDQHMNSEP